MNAAGNWIIKTFSKWLLKNRPPRRAYLCDFNEICKEVKPCDVLLIEGRNRISTIIKEISQSPWTHAILYIGKYSDYQQHPDIQAALRKHFKNPNESLMEEGIEGIEGSVETQQLIIESDLGVGTIVSPLEKYRNDHIRILRPQGLFPEDAEKVLAYAIGRLGGKYNIRHVLDLARFIFPWGLFPREYRSSLFQHNALKPTVDICSSMIAEAFQVVNFPVLPLVVVGEDRSLELVQRNPRLFTPSDFDYSPYFSVIKYPIFPLGKTTSYRDLRWRPGDLDHR